MRGVWVWARELVWLAIAALVSLVAAVIVYLITGDPVWVTVLCAAALTFSVLSLRDR